MHYLIKREKCDKCDGSGRKPVGQVYFNCTCTNGYIATQVSADEWLESKLADLRFTRSTDDGQECLIGIRFDEKEV